MELYIARHGTTEWNRQHRLQGRTDTPLDEQGVLMAETSGKNMQEQGLTFDLVYSSPLCRAYETAKLLAPGKEVVKDERLTELLFGEFEGCVSDDLLTSETSPFRFFKSDPVRYNELAHLFGGESLDELVARTRDFLVEMVEPHAGEDIKILVSGHGALNRGLLMHVRGIEDLSEYWGMGLQVNCGIIKTDVTLNDNKTPEYGTPGKCMIFYDESLVIDPEAMLGKKS